MDLLGLGRAILGGALVLVAPGLAWSFVFFPARAPTGKEGGAPGLDSLQRVALAVGLSVATIPVALFGASTFFRLPLTTGTVAIVLAVLILVPIGVLAARRRRAASR